MQGRYDIFGAMIRLSRLALIVPAIAAAQANKKPSPIPTVAEVNAGTPNLPGLPTHRLTLTESRRIDGKRSGVVQVLDVNLGPRGEMAVKTVGSIAGRANSYQTLSLLDSLGRRQWWVNSGRDGEIGSFSSFGWRSSDFWVYDARFSQIALLERGVVTKSLEMPTWIKPGWNDRKNYPLFGAFEVYSLQDDGSMVGLPRRPHAVASGAAFDSTIQVIVHVSDEGVIDRTLATIPSYDAAWLHEYQEFRRSRREGSFPPPGSRLLTTQWPRYQVSWDGKRVAMVSADSSHGAVDSVTVSMRDGKGAILYSTRFAFPRRSWTEAQLDSVARERYPRLDPGARAERAAGMRRVISDVESLVIGSDGSAWITLRNDGGPWPVVGIDPTGRIIGTVYLPRTYSMRAAERGALWLVDGRPVVKDLVRYSYR